MLIYTIVGYLFAITCLICAIISKRIDTNLKNGYIIVPSLRSGYMIGPSLRSSYIAASIICGLIATIFAGMLL